MWTVTIDEWRKTHQANQNILTLAVIFMLKCRPVVWINWTGPDLAGGRPGAQLNLRWETVKALGLKIQY